MLNTYISKTVPTHVWANIFSKLFPGMAKADIRKATGIDPATWCRLINNKLTLSQTSHDRIMGVVKTSPIAEPDGAQVLMDRFEKASKKIKAKTKTITNNKNTSFLGLSKYPGSKSKHVENYQYDPNFDTYIDVCVGMGSMFTHVKKQHGDSKKYHINDANPCLANLYTVIRDDVVELKKVFLSLHASFIKIPDEKRKDAFMALRDGEQYYHDASNVVRAATWLFYQTYSFNGKVEKIKSNSVFASPAGSIYSCGKNKMNNIEYTMSRVDIFHDLLQGVNITCIDMFELLKDIPENSFVYLDPPYRGTKIQYGFEPMSDEKHSELIKLFENIPASCEGFYCNMLDGPDDTFYNSFQTSNMLLGGFGTKYMNGKAGKDVILHRKRMPKDILYVWQDIMSKYAA